jgi:flagellar protein FliO/FliZ
VLAAASTCQAAETEALQSMAPGLLQATLGLAVVLALIWGAGWLVRRLAPKGSSSRSPIKLVATQALGPRERVVLVELGENWLLLGVAAGNVTALHTMPKVAVAESVAAEPLPFARLLALARRRKVDE